MIPEDPYGEIQMLVSELPDSARTIVAKSREFRMSGDTDFAVELLRRALARDRAPILLIEHADLLLSEKQEDDAIEFALEGLQGDPRSRHGRDVVRRALVATLPGSAVVLLRTALDFAAVDSTYTEELLLAGLESQPEALALREQLAQLYAREGRLVDCIQELHRILEINPDHDDAMVMLAAAFIKQGDYPRGQRLLNRARARGVDSAVLAELESRIEAVVGVISRSKKS